MSLQTQADADSDKADMHAQNARLAAEHAALANRYADRAGEAAEAARTLATGVMDGSDPDVAAARAFEAQAGKWAADARKASDNAAGIPSEGNAAMLQSQMEAMTGADNAAMSLNRAMGAVIAVQGYANRNAVVMDNQAVANTYAHIEMLQDLVSWIVSADADDVSSAAANASSAADLASRLAEDSLAEGGHDSQTTLARVAEMSGLMSENAAIETRIDAVLAEAAADYDSAIPLFEDGKMNKAGTEIADNNDLATGGIVRTGENGINTRAFTVDGETLLQSALTISSRNELDYIGPQRIVSAANPEYDSSGLVGVRHELVEYDRWTVGKPYEYITIGAWLAATDPKPYSISTNTVFGVPNGVDDILGSYYGIDFGLSSGVFVFANRNMLWERKEGGGVSAQYNDSHITILEQSEHAVTPVGGKGISRSGPAHITVNFDANTLGGLFRARTVTPSGVVFADIYTVEGLKLNDDSTFSKGENPALQLHTIVTKIEGTNERGNVDSVSGGIFGPEAEEIAGTIVLTGRSDTNNFIISTGFGGRHSSYQ